MRVKLGRLRVAVAGWVSVRVVDLWFWRVGGVSDVSLRRRMKRRGAQREKEGLCLCLSRCVICSRLSKHLQSAGSPGMQRQGWGWEQQPWETAALLNLCRLVPPRAECQHRQCQRCVGLIVTGPVSSHTHLHTHTLPHTHAQLQQAHSRAHCLACRLTHINRERQKPEAPSRPHTHTHTHTFNCLFTQPHTGTYKQWSLIFHYFICIGKFCIKKLFPPHTHKGLSFVFFMSWFRCTETTKGTLQNPADCMHWIQEVWGIKSLDYIRGET